MLEIEKVINQIFLIIEDKVLTIEKLTRYGICLHEVCLISEDENVIFNILQIHNQLNKKIKKWWTDIQNGKQISDKRFSFSIINGIVDKKLSSMNPKSIVSRINLGLIIPIEIKQENCYLISSEKLIEIINKKN